LIEKTKGVKKISSEEYDSRPGCSEQDRSLSDKLDDLSQRIYYKLRDINYFFRIYPSKKTSFGTSFRNYELYNLHGNDDLLKSLLEESGNNEVIFDIGANIGTYSLALASKYQRSEIMAFEPNVDMFRKLKKNLLCNVFKNLKIYNIGLSDQNGRMPFYVSSLPEISSFKREGSERWSGKVKSVKEVEVKRLDTVVENTKNHPDRIKLDVEGHGLKVLKGGQKTLREDKPKIYMERHEVGSEKDEEALEDFFHKVDYAVKKQGMNWMGVPKD